MTLAFDRDGQLLAGTESPGRVFRLDASGKPFVLLDSSYNEIHTLRVDSRGNIYVAAVSGRGSAVEATATRAALRRPAPRATDAERLHGDHRRRCRRRCRQHVASTGARRAIARGGASAAGALFRILPDGAWDLLWESREDTPYDVAIEADGDLLVATGNSGKIFRLAGDPFQPTLDRPRQRAAGHRRFCRQIAKGACWSPPRTRASCCGSPRRAPSAAPTPRMSATRRPSRSGARSSGRRSRRRAAVSKSRRARATRARPTRPGATGAPLHRSRRQHDHQPASALPAVARDADCRQGRRAAADVGHRGVPAAQHPAARHVDHRSPAGHGVPASVPDRSGDRRLRRRPSRTSARNQTPGTVIAHRSDGASTRRG